MNIFTRFVAVSFLLGVSGETIYARADSSFTPGHIYTPTDGGVILEWDEKLNIVGSVSVPGLSAETGAIFNPDGNLVTLAYYLGGPHLLEINARGGIVREFDTQGGSLLRGSYIDYDPVTERYAFADGNKITVVDRNFNLVGHSEGYNFARASGVSWAGGGLLATDQNHPALAIFDSNLQFVSTPLFAISSGIDVVGDTIYGTNSGEGSLIKYNYVTSQYTELAYNTGFGAFSDVKVLPNGNLLTISTTTDLKIFSPNGVLLNSADLDVVGDSIAYYQVPAPGCLVFLILGICRGTHRRWRS